MAIDTTERLNLEKECKKNNSLFREKTRLEGLHYCKASLTFLGRDLKTSVICPKDICRHCGDIYNQIERDGSIDKDCGFYLCNHVPKKDNSQTE